MLESITFSINLHAKDGDVYGMGIYLHIGNNLILRVESTDEIKEIINNLTKIKEEIDINY